MLDVGGWITAVRFLVIRAGQSPGVPFLGPSARSRVPVYVGVLRPGTGTTPGLLVSEVLRLLQVPEYRVPCVVHDNFPANRGTPYRAEL